MGLTEKQTVKELMIKYGFAAPDMTVTEFVEDILPSAQPTEASCWGCNCPKMEILREQKTFSEMVHLHDAETHDKCTEIHACDLISRQAAIDTDGLDEEIRCEMCRNPMHTNIGCDGNCRYDEKLYKKILQILDKRIKPFPSAQPESTRTFVELVVGYPDPELCTYKEYRGKPYYSIKYIENGERYVGFGTYKPEVLSQYLKENFISPAQQDRSCIDQIKWERDTAIQQLNELDYSFGEAIRHDKDAINRKGAINAVCTVLYPDIDKMNDAKKVLKEMPSVYPEYYDYSDIEPLWKSFAEENDINLTSTAKQLKDAMWCGYRKGKADAQPDSCDGCEWEYAFGYGECHHCKRHYNDMYEVKDEG